MHIIALKATNPDDEEDCKRYNYIVHPLAYRGGEGELIDESVDAMQWSICHANDGNKNKVPKKVPEPLDKPTLEERRYLINETLKRNIMPAFDDRDKWGDRCHGVEVFNDFT